MLDAAPAARDRASPFPAYGDSFLLDAAALQAQIGRPIANQLPAVQALCVSIRWVPFTASVSRDCLAPSRPVLLNLLQNLLSRIVDDNQPFQQAHE